MGNSNSNNTEATRAEATRLEEDNYVLVQKRSFEDNNKLQAWFDLFCTDLTNCYIEDLLENRTKHDIVALRTKFNTFYTETFGHKPADTLFHTELAKRCRSEYDSPYKADYKSNLGYWEMRHMLWSNSEDDVFTN